MDIIIINIYKTKIIEDEELEENEVSYPLKSCLKTKMSLSTQS